MFVNFQFFYFNKFSLHSILIKTSEIHEYTVESHYKAVDGVQETGRVICGSGQLLYRKLSIGKGC